MFAAKDYHRRNVMRQAGSTPIGQLSGGEDEEDSEFSMNETSGANVR
jgi:hypothetical protein